MLLTSVSTDIISLPTKIDPAGGQYHKPGKSVRGQDNKDPPKVRMDECIQFTIDI